jgi:RNA polymerase primary sigma factor
MKRRDSLDDYLKEISRTPLLKRKKEVALFNQIAEGDQKAKDEMIQANLRLVVSVAKEFRSSVFLSFFDIIQEGNIGLIIAVEKFDHTRGFKFSTYAYYWIYSTISRAIRENISTIRVPAGTIALKRKIRRAEEEYLDKHNVIPQDEELAEILNVKIEAVQRARLSSTHATLELDRKSRREEPSLLDFISDPKALFPIEEYERERKMVIRKRILLELIENCLDKREKEIIFLRFGLNGYEKQTLRQIGVKFGVSREWIRQIEKKSLEKLKEKSPIDPLTQEN